MPVCATTSKPWSSSRRATPSRRRTESSARTTRTGSPPGCASPCPAGSRPGDARRAPRRGRRARAGPSPWRVGAADAVVGDLDHRVSVHGCDANRDRGRLGVLGDVGERLGDDVVGGGLDRLGQAVVESSSSTGSGVREAAPRGRRRGRGRRGRRVDPAGELAELLERLRQLVRGLAEKVLGLLGVGARRAPARGGA